jgi:hypothetical protein
MQYKVAFSKIHKELLKLSNTKLNNPGVLGAHTCNSSYLRGWDEDDLGSWPAQAKIHLRPYLNGKKLSVVAVHVILATIGSLK